MITRVPPFEVAGVIEGNWTWRRMELERLDSDLRLDSDDASMYGGSTLPSRRESRASGSCISRRQSY